MGRPNTPTELKKAMGNRGKRRINRQEPDPEYLDDLAPPAWLPDAAKEVWNEYAPKLRKAKVLTVIDVMTLCRWCVDVARYKAAVADLERAGVMLDRKGEKADAPSVINQLFFVEGMLGKRCLATEREFGMTPAARTRVQIESQLTLFPKDAGTEQQPGKGKENGAGYFTGSGSQAPH